jgi:hypothetical protein
MLLNVASHCLAILGRIAATVIAGLLTSKLSDHSRSKKAENEEAREFAAVVAQMPEFIADIADMLIIKPTAREFSVTSGNTLYFTSHDSSYERGKHDDPLGKVRILENRDYVNDVTKAHCNCPRFRMTERFVDHVISWRHGKRG